MRRTFLAIVVLAASSLFRLAAADDLSPADQTITKQADALLNQEDFAGAEKLTAEVVAHNPTSREALLHLADALRGAGEYEQSLAVSHRAVALNSYDTWPQFYVGIALVHLHRYAEAIVALEMVHAAYPRETVVDVWLSEAYRKSGNTQRADELVKEAFHAETPDRQTTVMDQLGDMHYQLKEGPEAVRWWRQAANQGDKLGAQALAACYSRGFGVPYDGGEQEYWTRRSPLDSYPWFPRLAASDKWIAQTHGWILVLILLLMALLLPEITVGLGACLVGRRLTTDPAVHWTERARRCYPFTIYIAFCHTFLPFFYATVILDYPRSMLPVPRWILCIGVFFIVLYSLSRLASTWEKRYRPEPNSPWQAGFNLFTILLLFAPMILIFSATGAFLANATGWSAVAISALGMAAYLTLQFGGWIWFARLLRLAIPADAELVAMAEQQARARNLPVPRMWLLRWAKANALAFVHANTIMFTVRARKVLSHEETDAVLAHELAHICEDRTTKTFRLLAPLVFFPVLLLPAPWNASDPALIFAAYLAVFALFLALQKVRRRMEVRADTFGLEAQKSAGAYASALAHLYEDNLVPAVMPGKRKVHPHLYDRLIATGVTPDYLRPKPASRWGFLPAVIVIFLNVVLTAAIWLLLF